MKNYIFVTSQLMLVMVFLVLEKPVIIAQQPDDPIGFLNTQIEMSNTVCDVTQSSGVDCTIMRNWWVGQPLELQELEDNSLYQAVAYYGDFNDVQGTLIQKLDIITGQVKWQSVFNFSTYDSTHQEKPIALNIIDDQLQLLTFQRPEEFDSNQFIPHTFYQFYSSSINLSRRLIDINSGEIISENVISADKFTNGNNSDSDYSQGFVPLNQDQIIILSRTHSNDSLNLGFVQQGAQFQQEQVLPLGNFDSLTDLGQSVGADFKRFGFNFYISEDKIYHYEKVQFHENGTAKVAVLLEIHDFDNQVESLIESYIVQIDEDIFDKALIQYADDKHYILKVISSNDTIKYYLFNIDGTLIHSFNLLYNGQELGHVIFTKSSLDNTILSLGSSIVGDRNHLVISEIGEVDIKSTDTLRMQHEFYTFSPSKFEIENDLILVSGQYSNYERDDLNRVILKDNWITNFTILNRNATKTQNIQNTTRLIISPNPVVDEDILSVDYFPLNKKSSSYSLFGISGNRIKGGPVFYGENAIDISNLNSGLYFISILSGQDLITRRIVKL